MFRKMRPDCARTPSSSPIESAEPKKTSTTKHPFKPYSASRSNRPRWGAPTRATQPEPKFDLVTPTLAIDCEFAIATHNLRRRGPQHRPGRISIVNERGKTVYDVFACFAYSPIWTISVPPEWLHLGVYEYDISPQNGARPIEEVCDNVRKVIEGRTVVGHAVKNDIKIFPPGVFAGVETRDTQMLEEYREYSTCPIQRRPKLSRLAEVFLRRPIQGKEHSSVEDAVATMDLYRLRRDEIDRTQKVQDIVTLRSMMHLLDGWISHGTLISNLKHCPLVNSAASDVPGSTAARLKWLLTLLERRRFVCARSSSYQEMKKQAMELPAQKYNFLRDKLAQLELRKTSRLNAF